MACALEFVAETFDGDRAKTLFWPNTGNPNFGGPDPKTLIISGRYHKVLKFILAAKERNPFIKKSKKQLLPTAISKMK